MSHQKTLYAILIGIDDYPKKGHQLEGCVNDIKAVEAYLDVHCQANDIQFSPKLLLNNQATRKGIIDSFALYNEAKKGDLCLFYFCGHGSQTRAFPEFKRVEHDGLCETFVCYDSRLPNGYDLIDKELAYLIHEATKGKQVHFLTIVDACHSGNITRFIDEEVTTRMAGGNPNILPLNQYYQKDKYTVNGSSLEVPVANHIVLSACSSYESSQEKIIEGKKNGIFTFALLETLRKNKHRKLTYKDLIGNVTIKVQGLNSNQNPSYDAHGVDENTLFLDGVISQNRATFKVNQQGDTWMMNAGEIHGITSNSIIRVIGKGIDQEAEIKAIQAGHTSLDIQGLEDSVIYDAFVQAFGMPKLKIGFRDVSDASTEVGQVLIDFLQNEETSSSLVAYQQDQPDYVIEVQDQVKLALKDKGTDPTTLPLFKRVEFDQDADGEKLIEAVEDFVEKVESIARYRKVLSLDNENQDTFLDPDENLEVELYRILEHRDQKIIVKEAKVEDIASPIAFHFEEQDGNWKYPHYKLQFKAKGNQTIYLSLLYFAEGFEIKNLLNGHTKPFELRPGDDWQVCQELYQGIYYDFSPLVFNPELYRLGETQIKNYIKLIVSTEPFDVSAFLQPALEMPKTRSTDDDVPGFRGTGRDAIQKEMEKQSQWGTKHITLSLEVSAKEASIKKGMATKVGGFTIEGHPALEGTVKVVNSNETARSLSYAPPSARFGMRGLLPANMASRDTSTRDLVLDTLQLNIQDSSMVNEDQPIKLSTTDSIGDGEAVFPFGFDPETELYYPLGFTDPKEKTIVINNLPDVSPTDSTDRGLVNSIHIFLQSAKVPFYPKPEVEFPVLAASVVDEHENVIETDKDPVSIAEKVNNANRIVILVHGLIGDNKDKVKIQTRCQRPFNGATQYLKDIYDLMLTFDYESLNKEIEQSAKDLKQRLEAVGIGPENGKTVHLVAHSMGGLVSRYYLEQLGGSVTVSHFIQVGTPNLGSPLANVFDYAMIGLFNFVNYLIPGPIGDVLSFLGKTSVDAIDNTTMQLKPDSPFLQHLNVDRLIDPKIPYTLIPGDIDLIPQDPTKQRGFFAKLFKSAKDHYLEKLEEALFNGSSDKIVSVDSILGVNEEREFPPVKLAPVGCNHFAYFNTEPGVKILTEVLFGLYDEEHPSA